VPVAKRVRNGQVTWRARWRDDTGAQRSKSFRRKVDAERFMTNLDHGRLNGAYVDPSAGRMTVGEWSERWMSGQVQLKPKTRASYESLLRCWVLPRWEKVQLVKVTFGAVAEWVGSMTLEGLSASRTRQAYHVLTGMLDDAVKDGRLVRNPAAGVDLPRIESRPRRYLRHDQLHALAAACGPYQALVLTLGYCGLRWGEAAALRVHNLDLDRGRIEVSQAVVEVNGRIVVGSPKSHQSRWLPVPSLLLEGLREQVAGKQPEDLVFPSPQGSYLRVQNFGVATSTGPRRKPASPDSSRTSCGTPPPRSPSRPGPRSRRFSGCWATLRPLSRWTATATCSRTRWTRWPPAWTTPCGDRVWSRCGPRPNLRCLGRRSQSRKPALTCGNDGCPRQDSNLRRTV
jgi:integrase